MDSTTWLDHALRLFHFSIAMGTVNAEVRGCFGGIRRMSESPLPGEFNLIAEQRHLYIEPPWELESALVGVRTSPQLVEMCCPL